MRLEVFHLSRLSPAPGPRTGRGGRSPAAHTRHGRCRVQSQL